MEVIIVIFSIVLEALGYTGIYLGAKLCIDAEGFDRFIGIIVSLLGVATVILGAAMFKIIGG